MNQLCKVLIVDDEILVRQGIKYVLDWEREGFQIVGEAANGREALNSLQVLQPHIIITDIVMPVMDGEELTRLVKRDYPDTEVIVLSSFSEFHYVRSTFQNGVADYILKPKLEAGSLLHVLQKTRERIPGLGAAEVQTAAAPQPLDTLLSRMLSGYRLQPADEAFVKRQFPHELFSFLGWETGRQEAADVDDAANTAAVALHASVSEALEHSVPGLVLTALPGGEPNAMLLLVNLQEEQRPALVQALNHLAHKLAGQVPELRLSLSRTFRSLNELAVIHQESYLKLQQYRFFLPDQVLLVHEGLPSREALLPKFNLTQFTEQLKRQHLEEAFSDLRQYVDTLSRQYDGDVFQFKSFLGNILFNVTNQFSHLEDLEEGKYGLFRAVDEAHSADEAVRILDGFLARVMELTSTAALAPGSNANMTKLLQYMEEHYAEPLSLTELARHFHFNPSYLSSLFTTYNKEGFKEHLNTIRTGKAAELLRAGEAAISEISSLVGYGDHSYFCKVFKKYTGLSPSGYRRQHYGQE